MGFYIIIFYYSIARLVVPAKASVCPTKYMHHVAKSTHHGKRETVGHEQQPRSIAADVGAAQWLRPCIIVVVVVVVVGHRDLLLSSVAVGVVDARLGGGDNGIGGRVVQPGKDDVHDCDR